ncbi:hypothetical protein ABH931_005307 [Streptacidiphilus sp. MAP12-33]|uniref:SCO3242 family prenyltransferase n=1 Tax=Streptacidiphilus sp. MAP12-33 TaxID=3156266 RepID=UPI0035186DBD
MTTTPRRLSTDLATEGRESAWPWAYGSPQLPLDITAATVASAAAATHRPARPFAAPDAGDAAATAPATARTSRPLADPDAQDASARPGGRGVAGERGASSSGLLDDHAPAPLASSARRTRGVGEPTGRPATGRWVGAAASPPGAPRPAGRSPRLRLVRAASAQPAAPAADAAGEARRAGRWEVLAQLVRAPAALTVPGDVLVGAVASGRRPGPRVAAVAGASVALYWAGMALNDWADRDEDAVERPERPIPSGRISAPAALGVAVGLTATGLGLGALGGGRRGLLLRTLPLAASVWAYDLGLRRTRFGPAAMAAARALDVLHGADRVRPAAAPAGAVALHTLILTRLSRLEVHGAESSAEPRRALATTAVLAAGLAAGLAARPLAAGPAAHLAAARFSATHLAAAHLSATHLAAARFSAAQYAADLLPAQLDAERSRSADDVRAAVGAGIHALLPLQAALLARAGNPRLALPLLLARPVAGRLARKVAPT